MTSVCPGCVHEQAHGHADVTHCADRVPAAWCSCDMLRRAEAERDEAVFLRYCYEEAKASERRALSELDRYRDKALSAECRYRIACGICGSRCDDDDYCAAVIEEVGGHGELL